MMDKYEWGLGIIRALQGGCIWMTTGWIFSEFLDAPTFIAIAAAVASGAILDRATR